MSEDWKVGDLAVCVDARQNPGVRTTGDKLQEGSIYRVSGIGRESARHSLYGADSGLFLEGMRSGSLSGGYAASRFRKIRPDEHEGEREDWQLLLDSMKRKVRA